jgi:hypothetical protein
LRDGETGSGLTARSWLLSVDVGSDPDERDVDLEDDVLAWMPSVVAPTNSHDARRTTESSAASAGHSRK